MITIPTWITLARLFGIPFLFYSLYQSTATAGWLSLGIFLILSLTDWLDGYLARRLKQTSDLGKFLDPLVDKLLILAPLLVLVEQNQVPAWGVFLILFRELAIAGWRVNQPVITGANQWGKLKTVTQIVAIAVLIAPVPSFGKALGLGLFWLAVVITLVSGVAYLWPRKSSSLGHVSPSKPQTSQELTSDVTNVTKHLQQLQLVYHMATELSQFRGGFLARVTHELRSPLNSILGTHQLILSDLCEDATEEREFIRLAHQATLRMIDLLDTVLKVAKVEQGRLPLTLEPVSITTLLADVQQLITIPIRDRNLTLLVFLPADDITVLGDAHWLQQVLLNILDTAIRGMEDGTMRLSAEIPVSSLDAHILIETQCPAHYWADPVDFLSNQPETVADLQFSSGLNILLDQMILEQMGGRLEIITTKPGWTRLQCVVPLST
jgi:CDP-diacylglycerol---glycerol-3-phosphate 3-phosphatidyltransferase